MTVGASSASPAATTRTAGFEQAAHKQRITLRELEDEGSFTRAGEKMDRAFERLRADGFLPQEPASASTMRAGEDALEAVRAGRYRADLGAP